MFAEVLQGKRPMDWPDWAMFIYNSQYLIPLGQRVALWAVETLQRALGADFLHRPAPALDQVENLVSPRWWDSLGEEAKHLLGWRQVSAEGVIRGRRTAHCLLDDRDSHSTHGSWL